MLRLRRDTRSRILLYVQDRCIKLGISIGNRTVRDRSQIVLPEGVIVDGEIIDAAFLSERMGWHLRKNRIRNAAIVLDSPHIVMRLGMFPNVSETELSKIVEASYEQYFSFSDMDTVFSWRCTRVYKDNSEVMMAAIPLRISEGYVRLFTGLRLDISYIDFFENCVLAMLAGQENYIFIYRRKDRLVFIYQSQDESESLIWNVSLGYADGLPQLKRYCTNIAADRLKIDRVYLLRPCPDWVDSFFEGDNIVLSHLDEDGLSDWICYESAFLRPQGRGKKDE